ncbi:hypothetical protein ACROAE_07500 [Shewanella sp. MF05960]
MSDSVGFLSSYHGRVKFPFNSARILLKSQQDNQGLVNIIDYILSHYTD